MIPGPQPPYGIFAGASKPSPANGGLLAGSFPSQQQQPYQRSLLDKILGLYGADPNTHIPQHQRKGALGQGLMDAGLATLAAGGRGHDSLTPGQAIGTMLGTMRNTGKAIGMENQRNMQRQRINDLIRSGRVTPQDMQQIMLELISAGDIDGARAISEVLKSQVLQQQLKTVPKGASLYDANTGRFHYPNNMMGPQIAGWRSNLTHPDPDMTGQYQVPYDEQGNMIWDKAVKEQLYDPYRESQRALTNELRITGEFEDRIKGPENAMRFIGTGLDAVQMARIEAEATGGDLYVTGPQQINLLYAFIRGIDPESVVRTGEVDLARKAASLKQRFLGYIDMAKGQAVLVPADMVEQVEEMLKAHHAVQTDYIQRQLDQHRAMGQRHGIPASVFRNPLENIQSYGISEVADMVRAGYDGILADEARYMGGG